MRLGELLDRAQARLPSRLGERRREQDSALLTEPASEVVHELARVNSLVPDVEVAFGGEVTHRLAVLAYAIGDQPPAAIRRDVNVAGGDLRACRHPLDIPLPWPGERLTEVV